MSIKAATRVTMSRPPNTRKAIVPPAKTASGGTIYFGSVMKKT